MSVTDVAPAAPSTASALRAIPAKLSSRTVELLLLGLAPILWAAPARRSLWLDEGQTYWVIKDGLGEALRRSWEYQWHSPLYYVVAWLALTVGGASEFVLRAPSLIAVGVTTWTVYALGRRLFDAETGLIGATFFAYWVFLVSNMAYNARPYALAVLLVTSSTLALLRWLDSGRLGDAAAYVGLATLLVYMQPLFAGLFAVHLLAVVERRWRGATSVSIARFCGGVAVVGVLSLPLVPQMIAVGQLSRQIWVHRPSVATASSWILWLTAVVALLALVRRRLPSRPPLFFYVWCVAAAVWLVVIALLTGDPGPISRYTYWGFPATVLAIAGVLRVLSRPRRVLVLVAIALIAFAGMNRPALEDWRQATELARPLVQSSDTPVLVRTGLPQARVRKFLEEPEARAFVLAPLALYGMPGAVRPLPHDLDEDYLRRVIVPDIEARPRIILLAHDYDFQDRRRLPLQTWFEEHLPSHRSRSIARIANLIVVVYDRVSDPRP